MTNMETRQHLKRRCQSSPRKSARIGLDFGESPSPKKRRIEVRQSPKIMSKKAEVDSFTTRTFYGKREKTHFPHSPKRRKAVDQVLEKLSDENTDSDDIAKKLATKAKFDFHSSGSADSDTDTNRSVLKQKNQKQLPSNKKVPLNVTSVKKTPKTTSITLPNSTGKLPDRHSVEPQTPVCNGKRFFKTRTPGSVDRTFGSMVIKKGFDIKFVAKRSASKTLTPKSERKRSKNSKSVSKTKTVNKVKATEAYLFMKGSPKKTDGTEADEDAVSLEDEKENMATVPSQHSATEQVDSGVDTANSADLFSTQSNEVHERNVCNIPSEKVISNVNYTSTDSEMDCGNIFDDDDDGSISLISTNFYNDNYPAGSEDLFSTPDQFSSMKNDSDDSQSDVLSNADKTFGAGLDTESPYVSEITPVSSKTNSPSSKLSGNSPSSKLSGTSPSSKLSGNCDSKGPKLFPIFMKGVTASQTSSQPNKQRTQTSPGSCKSSPGSSVNSQLLRYVHSKDNMEQMIIDAGQVSRYGATQCEVCGMVYTQSEPADETMHMKFHQSLLNVLKFPGWKKERTVQEYVETGCRVIMVKAEDPKYAKKKVVDILKIMGQELGFAEASLGFKSADMAFLFISDNKKVEGCCVCQPIKEGYRVIVDSQSSSGSHQSGQQPWYSSEAPERALIGISGIWVHSQARRKGIATKLLDCVRQWSVYGTQIPRNMMAFSDPTNDGKILATKYTGTPKFLVYKYQ